MRTPRCLIVATVLLTTLVVPAGASSAGGETGPQHDHQISPTTDCRETSTGYRCLYGPFPVEYGMNTYRGGQGFPAVIVRGMPDAGFITRARASIVDSEGLKVAGHAIHLHHAVWLNLAREDITCPGFPADRFFATGKERTPMNLPDGYGYYWDNQAGSYPGYWAMNVHLDGMHKGYSTDVWLKLNMDFEPGAPEAMTDISPLWLDVDNCSDSEYDVTKGQNEDGRWRDTRVWRYTMPASGRFVQLAGHLHDGGVALKLWNITTGERVFTSRAIYGRESDPGYLTKMTSFSADPGLSVQAGDVLELRSTYRSRKTRLGVMGIMLSAFVADAE
jgi:hypothetical protein